MIIVLFIVILGMVYAIDVWKGTKRTAHFGETNNSHQEIENPMEHNQTKR
ncbi:MAG: Unknown protein [uncultured Sulfurovum sp.]|uniref:Uncharacterized protein n=1 Tax=uncultured Sulfurovum sp. TaxID=269237 RepID=A0A6S6TZM6_9BACT|nr:MAG: Unknown protein [uncultured Sulfurovum sp.]